MEKKSIGLSTFFTLLILIVVLDCKAQRIFSVTDYGAVGDGQTDDSAAFARAWNDACTAMVNNIILIVPFGKTFLLTPMRFQGPCLSNSFNFQIMGNLVAPRSIPEWKNRNCWLDFVSVDGLLINGIGQIDANGPIWWDQCLPDISRPTALQIRNSKGVQLSGLTHINSPRNHIGIASCNGLTISGVHITAPADSDNTDGIDIISSSQIYIRDSFIGTGDDCVAINSGCFDINITGVTCGPGHGISVGSLGMDGRHDTVEQIRVWNCSFISTSNGARIKTWQGGSGYARNIIFQDLVVYDVQNPIIIDQYYCEYGHDCSNKKSAVEVSDVTFDGITGSSASGRAIYLRCSESIGCANVKLDNINITSSDPTKRVSAYCSHAVGTFLSDFPGVTCF